jgi:hypothetical protein
MRKRLFGKPRTERWIILKYILWNYIVRMSTELNWLKIVSNHGHFVGEVQFSTYIYQRHKKGSLESYRPRSVFSELDFSVSSTGAVFAISFMCHRYCSSDHFAS